MENSILIRVDGNSKIGSGHVMRCSAIAEEATRNGSKVFFAVADNDSRTMVESCGFSCILLSGDYSTFASEDADRLAALASCLGSSVVLVDSYAINNGFFNRLMNLGVKCAYIDDAYTFNSGFTLHPTIKPVDMLINYSFGFSEDDYGYSDNESPTNTQLFIGPHYAPVRKEFRQTDYRVHDSVKRVLITCGSTNPDNILETLVTLCGESLPFAVEIEVVVGALSNFNTEQFKHSVNVHKNVVDMASLMQTADIAISAAGTTLYELAAIGVPTITFPLVENQRVNIAGFEKWGLGLTVHNPLENSADLKNQLQLLYSDADLRMRYSSTMRSTVDGLGTKRIAEHLCVEL